MNADKHRLRLKVLSVLICVHRRPAICGIIALIAAAAPPEPQFLSFAEATEILAAFDRIEDAAA